MVVSSLYYWADDETSLSKQLYEGGNGIATRVNNEFCGIHYWGGSREVRLARTTRRNGEQEEMVVVLALERPTGG